MQPLASELGRIIEAARVASEAVRADLEITEAEEARKDRIVFACELLYQLPTWHRETRLPELESGLPPALIGVARTWEPITSLLITGPTGAGKTRAAAVIVKRLLRLFVRGGPSVTPWIRRSDPLVWVRAIELDQAKREHPLGRGRCSDVSRACVAGLLVLDDLGWDRDPTAAREVIDERYNEKRPTLATSGLTEQELVDHYGAPTMRRLLETCGQGALVSMFEAAA